MTGIVPLQYPVVYVPYSVCIVIVGHSHTFTQNHFIANTICVYAHIRLGQS